MNLNGESDTHRQTVLNGKPLYGYDQDKKRRKAFHIFWHRAWIRQWRMSPTNKNLLEILATMVAVLVIIVILCALIGFGEGLF